MAVVLAGSRGGAPDALCIANQIAHKALIPVAGRPMLVRVVETLLNCDHVGDILISIEQPELVLALAEIAQPIAQGRVRLIAAAGSPSQSVLAAIQVVQNAWPILVTTADHPLLSCAMIDHLVAHAPLNVDAVAGIVEESVIRAAYPQTQRTYMRFRDIAFSGANLFLLRGPNAHGVVAFWRHIEANRKRPSRLIMALGVSTILRFVTRRLDLARALEELGQRCGATLGVVRLPFAQAAIDVDRPGDLALATQIIAQQAL